MRTPRILILLTMLSAPAVATGQSFEVYGSAGPTVTDTGNSVAVGAGVSPTSRITLGFAFERTHLSSRTSTFQGGSSAFRGGTLLLGTAELRFAPAGRDRIGPYGLVGIAAGVSRPNVNDQFTNRISNGVRAVFFGGGVQVPFNERLAAFVEARPMLGTEGSDGILAIVPIRAGMSWRF